MNDKKQKNRHAQLPIHPIDMTVGMRDSRKIHFHAFLTLALFLCSLLLESIFAN